MAGAAWRRWRRPQLALIALVVVLVVGYVVNAVRDGHSTASASTRSTTVAPAGTSPRTSAGGPSTSQAVALSTLPNQAGTTVRLIQRGGPYPYRQDGVVFGNAERHLPTQPRGFYHEYTVPTPGSPDRGARRIITGRDGSFYYTADHYDSFVRVDPDT